MVQSSSSQYPRALIVEDETVIALGLEAHLRELGFQACDLAAGARRTSAAKADLGRPAYRRRGSRHEISHVVSSSADLCRNEGGTLAARGLVLVSGSRTTGGNQSMTHQRT
jgi:hypothetical protein